MLTVWSRILRVLFAKKLTIIGKHTRSTITVSLLRIQPEGLLYIYIHAYAHQCIGQQGRSMSDQQSRNISVILYFEMYELTLAKYPILIFYCCVKKNSPDMFARTIVKNKNKNSRHAWISLKINELQKCITFPSGDWFNLRKREISSTLYDIYSTRLFMGHPFYPLSNVTFQSGLKLRMKPITFRI